MKKKIKTVKIPIFAVHNSTAEKYPITALDDYLSVEFKRQVRNKSCKIEFAKTTVSSR